MGIRENQSTAGLTAHDLKHTDWQELKPTSPFYLFVPRDNTLEAVYRHFVGIPDMFPVNSVGIVTAQGPTGHSLVSGGGVEDRNCFLQHGTGIGAARLPTRQGRPRLEGVVCAKRSNGFWPYTRQDSANSLPAFRCPPYLLHWPLTRLHLYASPRGHAPHAGGGESGADRDAAGITSTNPILTFWLQDKLWTTESLLVAKA